VLKLTIEDDEGKTTVVPLIRDEMTIGRQEGNTIRLTERNVSRRHARLLRQNGVIYIEDLASFTGIKLNGARINSVMPIRDGDQMQIGDYKIVLKSDRPSDRQPTQGERTTLNNVRAATPAMGSRTGMPAVTAPVIAAVTAGGAAVAAARPAPKPEPSEPPPPAAAPARAAAPAPAPAASSSPAPAPMEGQPTIPVRALGPAPEAAPMPGRLVVLSTELAGTEFLLDRPSAVIGRTDENDIQINHRSISRHHAKLVRDQDRYTIVDLQSANGVRVNGEDYERIELNPGDVVELGHVKLRFVGPFEAYTFDPRAALRGDRKMPSKVALIGAGVVVSIVGLIVVQRLASRSPSSGGDTVATAPAAPAAPPAQAPGAPTAARPLGEQSPADLLATLNQAVKNEDWNGAQAAARQLTAPGVDLGSLGEADRSQIAALARKVEAERKGSVAFAKFDEASGAKNYGAAIDWFDAIPAESLYKKRAQPRYEEARTLFVSEHLTAAETFRTQGRCAEAKQESDEVLRVDPGNQLIKEIVKLCRPAGGPAPAVAAAPRPAPRAHSGAPTVSGREVARNEAASPTHAARAEAAASHAGEPQADPEALVKMAREAWLHQQCGSAIDIARRALRARPGLSDAYQIITVCSCSLRDADAANRAYGKLDEKSRPLARAVCQKSGIALGE
jgi:pSer/pThr/pTyr-binding forkhead associated (FHA) protein